MARFGTTCSLGAAPILAVLLNRHKPAQVGASPHPNRWPVQPAYLAKGLVAPGEGGVDDVLAVAADLERKRRLGVG